MSFHTFPSQEGATELDIKSSHTAPPIYRATASLGCDASQTVGRDKLWWTDGAEIHSDTDPLPFINRIPTELVGEIFSHYLRAKANPPQRFSRLTFQSHVSSPVTISHVCRHWRDVSLSMATLWSSLRILRPDVDLIPMIQLWLARAGDCPLSLSLRQGEDEDHAHVAVEKILSLLLSRAHLWKVVDFRLSSSVHKSLLSLSEKTFKQLESATLDLRHWDHASADQLWRVLHASPALRHANWLGFDDPELPAHAPWSQLTHITISRTMTEGEVMELVKLCPKVAVLDLPYLERTLAPVASTCVTLPNLHTLKLTTSTSDYGEMFNHLELPGLMCLDITHAYGHSPAGSRSFISNLLTKSSCRLKKLILCDWEMQEDRLLDILALPDLQFLSELELSTHVTDRIVQSLTFHQDGSTRCLLPHLKAITLGESHASDGVLSDMVTSRLPFLKAFRVEEVLEATMLSSKLGRTHDLVIIDSLRRQGYDFYLSLEQSFST